MVARRKFSRELKLESVSMLKERGVALMQAARELDIHENALHRYEKRRLARSMHSQDWA